MTPGPCPATSDPNLPRCGHASSAPGRTTQHTALLLAGCQLPVEMFFPAAEYPTPEMETVLGRLGVRCRQLPNLKAQGRLPARGHVEAHLAGFTLKIAALVLSSFREVGPPEP